MWPLLSVAPPQSGGAQAVQIKEASSAGRERTEVRDRPSTGADAEMDGNERHHYRRSLRNAGISRSSALPDRTCR